MKNKNFTGKLGTFSHEETIWFLFKQIKVFNLLQP